MPPSLPEFTAAWTLPARRSGIDSLNFIEKLPLPTLKDDEVLVKIHAVSLNYRELMIVKVRVRAVIYHIGSKILTCLDDMPYSLHPSEH